MIWIGLAAVLMLALVVSAVNGAQQSAWMEGYTFGRLAAGSGDAAALAPVLPYGMGYAQRGPGFGGILFMLLGFGAIFFIGSRIVRYGMWRAWAAQNPGAMPPPPPWMHHRCGERQPAPAAEPAPGAER
jgi:hypothetical protein